MPCCTHWCWANIWDKRYAVDYYFVYTQWLKITHKVSLQAKRATFYFELKTKMSHLWGLFKHCVSLIILSYKYWPSGKTKKICIEYIGYNLPSHHRVLVDYMGNPPPLFALLDWVQKWTQYLVENRITHCKIRRQADMMYFIICSPSIIHHFENV